MHGEHTSVKTNKQSKLDLYHKIEEHFKPVFGKLLFELYRSPYRWYSHRQTYMRSLSTTSIVGYILGIGDRHSQNILFDKKTGDVIHIDLGVAFDQGKLLSTPELVPFRLTRDLVNCMGITGTSGAFSRGCEETMRVLRQNSEILFTLLDVFRYDPLYTWYYLFSPRTISAKRTKTPIAVQIESNEKDSGGNEEADRALFGVRKKLNSSLSVPCHVSELINSAIDPLNLSRMYPGWQAWM